MPGTGLISVTEKLKLVLESRILAREKCNE